jgi:hypothetical protein
VTAATSAGFKRRNYGQGHGYTLDGIKIPGVTTIIGEGIPKPGLIGWAGDEVAEYVIDRLRLDDGHVLADDLVADIRKVAKYPIPATGLPRTKLAKELAFAPSRTRDAGGLKGTQVHEIAKRLAETGEWTPGEGDEHLTGYADALEAWWHDWQPGGRVLVERPVLNRDVFYAGTFDLVAELRAPGWCLVCGSRGCLGRVLADYKAGRSGIFGETALQLAGYRFAEVYVDDDREWEMPEVDHCLGVWARPDGTSDTYPIRAGADEFRIFRYVYEIAKWRSGPDLFKTEGDPPIRTVKGDAIRPAQERAT